MTPNRDEAHHPEEETDEMKQMHRARRTLLGALGALAMAVPGGPAQAQAQAQAQAAYPDRARPIRIITPSGAGSIVDLLARAQAKAMADVAGLNVVVDNRPGAELVLGIQTFMNSPADGYTMLVTSSSSHAINPVLMPKLPYDPLTDFAALTGIAKGSLIMNLGPSTPFRSAGELVAAAKASPGKYTCGSASTTTRLACELFETTARVKTLNVPYKTVAAAMTALAAGETDLFFIDLGSSRAQWQSGRVRGVATTSPTRPSMLPEIPTMQEQGVGDYEVTAWFAAYFPRNTPPKIVHAMQKILAEAHRTAAFSEMLDANALEPLPLAGDALIEMNRKEIDKWKRVVQQQSPAR
ncbi:Bug family tripartite tricarboxylate transporter substrate binding protein [Pseudorhodoferax sp.]|uniref:Bug family tripartite tricarboxylate transporter substrate binding protein n=1 Tax=Pseudorhodoferax sp. TaxID=1993553 RepID=UPI0039E511EA